MKAFVFPGQGSQYKGMGLKLPLIREDFDLIIKEAEKLVDMNLKYLLFEANDEELKDTENAQITILLTSHIYFKYLLEKGILPDFVLGHSLGEYSALLSSGVLTFEEAIVVVKERAKIMKKFASKIKGVQFALLNIPSFEIEEIVNRLKEKGVIQIAGYNGYSQFVLSLEEKLVEDLKRMVNEIKGGRIIQLKTSLPFHSPLMKEAEEEFKDFLGRFKFNNPKIKFVSTVTSEILEEGEKIKEIMYKQITSPVRWTQAIEKMRNINVNKFYEVGPNKVLSNLLKKDYSDIEVYSVESFLEKLSHERI